MNNPHFQDLRYGVIYVLFGPERSGELNRDLRIIEKIAHPFKIQWCEEPGRKRDETLLVARRFNVGNVGQCATVSLRLSATNPRGVQFDALDLFRKKLFEVSDMDGGDIFLDEDDFTPRFSVNESAAMTCEDVIRPSAAPQDKTRVELPQRVKKAARWMKKSITFANENMDALEDVMMDKCESAPDLLDEEDDELRKLEQERKEALERIKYEIINYIARYHDDPKDLMAELLRGKVVVGAPGRVLINGDMKIVLPEYDEMEISMPAMCRTLYILFMKKRKQGKGIVLKNIDEYRDEIVDIYGLVKPGANDERVQQTVDNLCNPMSESLNQMISRINSCIRSVITDQNLARDYCISGNRGEPYSIGLEPQYLELPRAVTN